MENNKRLANTERENGSISLSLSLFRLPIWMWMENDKRLANMEKKWKRRKRKKTTLSLPLVSQFGCGWKMIKGWQMRRRKIKENFFLYFSPSLSFFRLPILMWKMIKDWQMQKRNGREGKEKKTTLSLPLVSQFGCGWKMIKGWQMRRRKIKENFFLYFSPSLSFFRLPIWKWMENDKRLANTEKKWKRGKRKEYDSFSFSLSLVSWSE